MDVGAVCASAVGSIAIEEVARSPVLLADSAEALA